jgi:hypothetical protein
MTNGSGFANTVLRKMFRILVPGIDCLLARHYGFTEEELDFIINYDIKYRMGRDIETEEG